MIIKVIFIIIALFFSFFCALFCYELHDNKSEAEKKRLNDLRVRKIHQFMLHLLGALVGWILLYYLLFIRLDFSSEILLNWEDLLILLIALIGITGYLPYNLIVKNWIPGK